MRRAAGACARRRLARRLPPRALGVSSSSSFSRKDNTDDSNADATTTDTKVSSAHHHHHLKADFRYAAALLRQRDYETYLCTCAVDASKRAVPLALRALNCETVIDVVHENDGNAALMKLKWWHDRMDETVRPKETLSAPGVVDHPIARCVRAALGVSSEEVSSNYYDDDIRVQDYQLPR